MLKFGFDLMSYWLDKSKYETLYEWIPPNPQFLTISDKSLNATEDMLYTLT